MKKYILQLFISLFLSTPLFVKAQDSIIADPNDVIVASNGTFPGGSSYTLGKVPYLSSGCYVIPFQLPVAGKNILSATLKFTISATNSNSPSANIDLYGLSSRVSSSVLGTDYYGGPDAGSGKIHDNIIADGDGTGEVITTVASLLTFIKNEYDNGNGAGKFVFLRLSPDDITTTQQWSIYSSETSNTVNKRPTLILTYGSAIDPTFDAPIVDQAVNEATNTILNIAATDPQDGKTNLTFTKTSSPSFVTLTDNGDGTAVVNIDPVSGDEGVYNDVTIIVTDQDGNFTEEKFKITVLNPNKVVVVASAADGYVVDASIPSYNPQITDELRLGTVETKAAVIGPAPDYEVIEPAISSPTSVIIPFQLPVRANPAQRVVGAKLKVYVAHGREWFGAGDGADGGIDIYGLKYVTGSDVIKEADFYTGPYSVGASAGNGDILEYGIQENFISKNNPLGYKDLSRYEYSVNQAELATYINAQYDAGAVDGNWIFIRLSLDADPVTRYQRFNFDGADGTSVQDYNEGLSRADIKPTELILDYVNLLPDITTTWDGTAWSHGIPSPKQDAIIAGNIEVGGGSSDIENILANNLLVKGSANINVYSGSNVYAGESFEVEIGANITIKSGGTFVCQDATTITVDGTYTVERTANESTHNYTYWSSPVNTTVEDALIATGSPKVYKYETSNFDDDDDDNEDDNRNDWQVTTGTMVAGRGYIAKASATDDPTIQTSQFILNGTTGINKGDISYLLSLSADGSGDADADLDDWNLIGNPYSSVLLAKQFIIANASNIYGTLYFWTHNTAVDVDGYYSQDDYAQFNLSGGTSAAPSGGTVPTGFIASGQGFFVEAKSATNVVFNEGMQLLIMADTDNNDFFKRGTELTEDNLLVEDKFWLNIASDNSFNQILVGFFENATNGIDNLYDGKKLDVGNSISFYSIVDNQNLAIQGRSDFIGDEIISLGFKSEISNTTSYKISIDNFEGVFDNNEVEILIRDKYLQSPLHNLNKSDYEFTVEKSGTYNDRFEISFVYETLSNEVSNLVSDFNIYPNPVTENFEILNADVSKVELYSVNGNKLLSFNKQQSYNVESLTKGVYLVRVTSTNGEIMNKKIIKK